MLDYQLPLGNQVWQFLKLIQVVRMANAAQSRATGPLFLLKTGCINEILVASGNRATANFEHWSGRKIPTQCAYLGSVENYT